MIRKRLVVAVAVTVVVALAWWLRREPSWSVTLSADGDPRVTPWHSVKLAGAVTPEDVTEDRLLKHGEWHYTWKVDSEPLEMTGLSGSWRSGAIGDHELTLIVESPWGTKRTASIKKTVAYSGYRLPDSPTLRMPDLAQMPTDPKPANLPFGIADVTVEKDKICQGESTQITLTAFDRRNRQNWLVPTVAGQQSWEGTFQALPGLLGPQLIPVKLAEPDAGIGGLVKAIDTYVYVEVMDCVAPFPMFVDQRPIPPNNDNISFRVRLYNGPAWLKRINDPNAPSGTATATRYRWTFGDGTSQTTTEGKVAHQFPREADRPDERETVYKVRVDALNGDAVLSTGFAQVAVLNFLRQLKDEQGLVQLVTTQEIGAKQNPEGTRSTSVTLTNIDPAETAQISEMNIHYVGCDGSPMSDTTAQPSSVFDKLSIPPKGKLTGKFTLPTKVGACYANADVAGTSSPGSLKVVGFFQLMMSDDIPGIPLSDEQSEVLDQATKLFPEGHVVTADDIQRLESEGKITPGVLSKDPFAETSQPPVPSPR